MDVKYKNIKHQMDTFVLEIVTRIQKTDSSLVTPIRILQNAIEIAEKLFNACTGAEKKKCVIDALTTICAGQDGVLGTADDVIDIKTYTILKGLIENDVISDMIDLVITASKKQLPINQIVSITRHVARFLLSFFIKK